MPSQGMSPKTLIAQANLRTEKRAAILDLNQEFLAAVQDFCLEHRWYWRRKTVTFSTVVGTATYDLAADDAALDCEQVCKNGVRLVRSATENILLPPVFDHEEQDSAIDGTSQGLPSAYFMEPGSTQTIRLTPVPGGVYTIRVSYWAVPNMTPDSVGDTVPLVPGFLHWLVQTRLEARLFRFALGEGAAKYQAAMAEYQAGLMRAAERRDFEEGRVREVVNTDCQDSVRSTY